MYSDEDDDDKPISDENSEDESLLQDPNRETDEFGNIACPTTSTSNYGTVQAMDDVEIIVQEEDTEPITQPIVKPIVVKRFSHRLSDERQELPRTTFKFEFLHKLMEHDHAIRNIAIIGHLLHGKTSFVDCLIEQTHLDFKANPERPIRFTDTLFAEQERGISIKSSPVSIVHQNLHGKSYVLNMMDTPGHVNFSDEVTAALRLSNGVLLVVDAVEGMMMNTEILLEHALREDMAITLCINKIDRLIFELRLPPNDAYHKLKLIIDEVNSIIKKYDEIKLLSPVLGNVCFASSQYSLCFTLKSFAKLYLERKNCRTITWEQLAKKFWGNSYLDGETSKFVRQPPSSSSKRSFVEFILEPLYKFFRLAIEEPGSDFMAMAENYNIMFTKEEKLLNVRPLLKLTCSKFFGDSFASFVDMIAEFVPTPKSYAPTRCPMIWTGPSVGCELTRSICDCDPSGLLIVHISKQYPSQDGTTFNSFGLVLSGTLRVGTDVMVLGESYSQQDREDCHTLPITKLWICNSRYNVEVRSVPAGNWCLIGGIDQPIVKTATVIDSDYHEDLYIFRPLQFINKSVIKIAVDPVNPSELPKMLEGLRKCNKSYPLLQTKVEESGEHVMIGVGELYLDCVMHDLRHMYSEIDIRVSDPSVCFSETVIDVSQEPCVGETPNKHNQFTMFAEPLDRDLVANLEKGRISLESSQQEIDKFFTKRYNWDYLSCRSIWAFGPETYSTNILLNDINSTDVDANTWELLPAVREPIVKAFHWTTREGPLCEEPIRGVKFNLTHAVIAPEPINRGEGQLISTARKVSYLSFLTAKPRLMEPHLRVEIVAPPDVVRDRMDILEELIKKKRRGVIISKSEIAGAPLYKVIATMPAIDSFGFETDLRIRTTGQAFCLSVFEEWKIVGDATTATTSNVRDREDRDDPLDRSIDQYLTPLEPQPTSYLAREFLLKTRRRKGLSEDVNIEIYK